MKKSKKIFGALMIFIVFLGTASILFGSTTHSSLKGDLSTKLELFMDQYSKEHDFSGVIFVAREGKIILSKGYGLADRENHIPNQVDTKFPIASITKSFTALSIMQLEEQGLLSTEDTVDKFIPSYPNGDKIKIHHLLSNTSGIPDFMGIAGLDKKRTYTIDAIIALTKEEELLFEPGTKFSYSNSGFALLGKIIEIASGDHYNDYVQKNIFNKAGMNNSYLDYKKGQDFALGYTKDWKTPDLLNHTITTAAGNIISTTEDLYKYDQALKNELLVSKEQLTRMETHFIDSAPLGAIGYGYGWYIMDNFISFGEKSVVHPGGINGFRTHFERFIGEDVTIIIFQNQEGKNVGSLSRELASIVLDKRYWFWQRYI